MLACVAGVKRGRGRGRGNLGMRVIERKVTPPPSSLRRGLAPNSLPLPFRTPATKANYMFTIEFNVVCVCFLRFRTSRTL